MSGLQLRDVIGHALRAMWPRRAQRELLLDLGERKGWTEADCDAAVDGAATWLERQLLLPADLPGVGPLPPHDMAEVMEIGRRLAEGADAASPARWAIGLGPVVGAAPKTLVNSLEQGLRADRPDHRWLRALARVGRSGGPADAWVFHRRSPGVVAVELAAMAGRDDLDAGDAVLLLSLLALWQRRRPTAEARGNRGRRQPRRRTPLPIGALPSPLAAPGQVPHLARAARLLGGEAGRALLVLALEAALTEAHLAPHPARTSRSGLCDSGEVWLRGVEAILDLHAGLLGADDAEVFRFRIARMRSWRDGVPQHASAELAVRSPYVRASLDLERARGRSLVAGSIDAATPGVMMLLPLLRARGFEVGT